MNVPGRRGGGELHIENMVIKSDHHGTDNYRASGLLLLFIANILSVFEILLFFQPFPSFCLLLLEHVHKSIKLVDVFLINSQFLWQRVQVISHRLGADVQ